jgi:ferredoxin--NADP+ reductase
MCHSSLLLLLVSFMANSKGAHIYFCGLKGMMPGIQDMLKKVAESKGLDYEEWLKGLKSKKQWHVEVY